jgi:hypothetical protein
VRSAGRPSSVQHRTDLMDRRLDRLNVAPVTNFCANERKRAVDFGAGSLKIGGGGAKMSENKWNNGEWGSAEPT